MIVWLIALVKMFLFCFWFYPPEKRSQKKKKKKKKKVQTLLPFRGDLFLERKLVHTRVNRSTKGVGGESLVYYVALKPSSIVNRKSR